MSRLQISSRDAASVVEWPSARARFDDSAFRAQLGVFFPVLTRLIRCQHVPAEVSRTLSDVFAKRVGPLILTQLASSR